MSTSSPSSAVRSDDTAAPVPGQALLQLAYEQVCAQLAAQVSHTLLARHALDELRQQLADQQQAAQRERQWLKAQLEQLRIELSCVARARAAERAELARCTAAAPAPQPAPAP